jgi:acyl-CoA synthetase (AMP-forming)/AMP-acid ligase II
MTITDRLADHARRRPDHPAVIEGLSRLTYSEFDWLVRRTASHLRGLGVRAGDIVGVCLADSADHLVVLYALARGGAVILPMDRRWTEAERERIATFFGAVLVVHEVGEFVADNLRTITLDAAWRHSVAASPGDIDFTGDGDVPLVLSLSSGTTGIPKGPLHTHAQTMHRFRVYEESVGMGPDDRYLSAIPLYFGAGRGFAMGTVYLGGTVIFFPPPYEAEALVSAVIEHEASCVLLVPTILRRLLELPNPNGPLLGRLKVLISTGATLHPEERDAILDFLCPNFVNLYGSTEGASATILLPEHRGQVFRSVGCPVVDTAVEIVDDEDQLVPAGAVGRIRYRSAATPDGFYRNPEASAEAFRDGWFYPGDLGYMDESGFLYLTGRSKDMIIRGGVNIFPTEIEETLLSHTRVRDTAVVAWPSPEMGEEIAAFVVTNGGVTEAELLAHCRTTLAPYKVPRSVFFIDDLPKSGVGKIQKYVLAQRLPRLTR